MSSTSASSCMTLAALGIVALTGFSACDGDHGGSGLAVTFDGPWDGTWSATSPTSASNPTPSGQLTLQLEQVGTTVTGTATFTGHPCLSGCSVSGRVEGHEMSGWFQAGSFQVMFSGSCPESGHCSGRHHANTMTATYRIQDGPCASELGAIQLTPVAADRGDASELGARHVGEVILIDQHDATVLRLPVFERREQAP